MCPNHLLFLSLITFKSDLSSSTLCKTTALVTLSTHFIFSILLHTHISNASILCFSLFLIVHVSDPYKNTLHTKHFANLFLNELSNFPHNILFFLLNASFAIPILAFISASLFHLQVNLVPKYLYSTTCCIFFPFTFNFTSSLSPILMTLVFPTLIFIPYSLHFLSIYLTFFAFSLYFHLSVPYHLQIAHNKSFYLLCCYLRSLEIHLSFLPHTC